MSTRSKKPYLLSLNVFIFSEQDDQSRRSSQFASSFDSLSLESNEAPLDVNKLECPLNKASPSVGPQVPNLKFNFIESSTFNKFSSNFKMQANLSLLGDWKYVYSHNFEKLMREMKINFLWRKLSKRFIPNQRFELNGDEWSFSSTLRVKTIVVKFKLNESFEQQLPGGQLITVTLLCCNFPFKEYAL